MKHKNNLLIISIIIVFIATFFISIINPPYVRAKSVESEKKFIRIVAGSVGGTWLAFSNKVAEILSRELPGITANASPSASTKNMIKIHNDEADIGCAYTFQSYQSYIGEGPSKKELKDLRHLLSLYSSIFQLVVPAKSDINDISDLKKKPYRISLGNRGSLTVLFTKAVLESYGIKPEDITARGGTLNYLGYSDSNAMMQDGMLDFSLYGGPFPHSAVLNVAANPGVRFLKLSSKSQKKIMDILPGTTTAILPAGTYKGQSDDIPTIGFVLQFVVSEELPDEIAYKILKAIEKNFDELKNLFAAAKEISFNKALRGNKLPLHPGAIRFYKEIGVIK
jgi:TRAP transporter TAXI family solute receptor